MSLIGVRGNETVEVVQENFISANSQVVAEEAPERTVQCSVRSDITDAEIVPGYRLKNSIVIASGQFHIARRILPQVQTRVECDAACLLFIRGAAASDAAGFRLSDQPI